MQNFYQTNNEILKFDPLKDINKIIFNHYICRKENLERINNKLPKGQFYLTITIAAKDLNLSRDIIRNIINDFIKKEIISCIYKPPRGKKELSIFSYNSVFLSCEKPHDNSHEESHEDSHEDSHDKPSAINVLDDIHSHEDSHEESHELSRENPHSKKEYIKRKTKNKYTADFETVWKMFLSIDKTGSKSKAYTAYKNTLTKYSKEQILKATEYYFKHKVPFTENNFIKTGQFFFDIGYISDYIFKSEQKEDNVNKVKSKVHTSDVPDFLKGVM